MILDGTNGETFPSWTTAGRPASPVVGQMGYNTTIGQFDCYTSGGWVSVMNTTSTSNKLTSAQMPTGSVIQVVTAKASGTTTSASTSPISLGISTSITVRAGSSVACFSTVGIYGSGNGGAWSSTGRTYLYRASTVLSTSEHMGVITSLEQTYTHAIVYLDASLSAGTYTYSVQGSSTTGGTLNYNRDAYMGNLILMEIAA
jgi:hypothetical protein